MASQSGRAPSVFDGFCKDPSATMSILSVASGILFFIGGISGLLTLNPITAMTSVYSMVFGLVIVIVECKQVPVLSALYRQLEYWAHFLVYPRGKAVFFVLVGILNFFSQNTWGLVKISALIIIVVGGLHFIASFFYRTEEAKPPQFSGAGGQNQGPPDLRGDAQREAFQLARDNPEQAARGASWLANARR
mmetsp:Transcript_8809/g.24326  ORF Transcript_8809/g.24326 Transcript_8809/m.24326 type:complete len:191 (-) Transcript_8809:450-1022(-)